MLWETEKWDVRGSEVRYGRATPHSDATGIWLFERESVWPSLHSRMDTMDGILVEAATKRPFYWPSCPAAPNIVGEKGSLARPLLVFLKNM